MKQTRWSALVPPSTTGKPTRPPPSVRVLLFTDPSGRKAGSGSRQRRLVFDSESVRRDEGVSSAAGSATGGGKEKYDEVVGGVGYKVGNAANRISTCCVGFVVLLSLALVPHSSEIK